jgi:hypothetical protein
MGRGTVDKDLEKPSAPNNRSSDWSSLDTNGVVGDLLAQQPSLSLGNTDNVSISDFRSYENQNLKQALDKFVDRSDQIYREDFENNEVDVINPPSTSSGTLNEDIDVENVREIDDGTEVPEKVVVIGKSEGQAQVKGSFGPSFSQGDKVKTVSDKTVETTAEANALAENIYDRLNVTNSYDFNLVNPGFGFELGEVITLQADSVGVNNQDLRITKFKREIASGKNEAIELEVRNVAKRKAMEDNLEQQVKQSEFSENANDFEQGDIYSLTYQDLDKCSNSNPSTGDFTLPNWITSSDQILEANLIVNRKSLAFDVPDETGDDFADVDYANSSSGANTSPDNVAAGGASVVEASTVGSNFGVDISSSSYTTIFTDDNIDSNNDTQGLMYYITLQQDFFGSTSANNYCNIRIENTDTGEFFPNVIGVRCPIYQLQAETDEAGAGPLTIKIPEDTSFETYEIQIEMGSNAEVWDVYRAYNAFGEHTHPNNIIDGGHTNADTYDDPGHTNPIPRGVNSISESSKDFDYELNNNGQKNVGNLNVGDSSNEIDIKSDLNDPSSNRTNTLDVIPASGDATVKNTVEIKAYRPV